MWAQLERHAQAVRSRCGHRDSVAEILDVAAQKLARVSVILDHQHERRVGISARRGRGMSEGREQACAILRHRRERRGRGQLDAEGRAHANRTFDPEPEAEKLAQRARDAKPEPRAAVLARGARVRLLERGEDRRNALGRDPDARIGHANAIGSVRDRIRVDGDGHAAGVRELHRVADEIDEHLAQLRRIRLNRPHRRRDDRLHRDAVLESTVSELHERILDEIADFDHGELQRDLPRLDLRQIQNVVDEREQLHAVGADALEVAQVDRLEIPRLVLAEHVREADDGVERRAELVAHACEELALGRIRRLRLFLRAHELAIRAAAGLDIAERHHGADDALTLPDGRALILHRE